MDATWGSGGFFIPENYEKLLNLNFLFCKPENFILEHFPNEEKWQLLIQPVSKLEFSSEEYIEKRKSFYESRSISFSD